MALPLALLGGAALRVAGPKLAQGALGQGAAKFGGNALMMQGAKQNQPGPVDDYAQHPFRSGAKVAGAVAALSAPTMGARANQAYTGLLQTGQFGA